MNSMVEVYDYKFMTYVKNDTHLPQYKHNDIFDPTSEKSLRLPN